VLSRWHDSPESVVTIRARQWGKSGYFRTDRILAPTAETRHISFSVRRAVKHLIASPGMPAAVDLESPPGPARQLRFELEQPRVEKPTAAQVDLLIKTALATHEPDLELPPVRVSGRMRRTLGSYTASKRRIAISSRLLAMGDDSDVRQVVLREVAVANPLHLEMWPLQNNNCPQKADEVSQVHLRPEGVPEVVARSRFRRSRPRRRLGDALARFRLDCLVLKYS